MGISNRDSVPFMVFLCLLVIVLVIGYDSYDGYRNNNYSSYNRNSTSHSTGRKQETNSYSVYSNSIRRCSQKERLSHLKEMCIKHTTDIEDSKIKTRFLIDSKNKVAFHKIAKSGSTTIKTIMLRIASNGTDGYFPNPQRIHSLENNAWEKYGMLENRYSLAEVRANLVGYTIFMVARHPISRVISAYKNKVLLPQTNQAKRFIPDINECLVNHFSSELITEGRATLTGFLEMILSSCKISTNNHWISYFKTSKPCHIEYQYILKLETLHADLLEFLSLAYKDIDYKQYLDIQFNAIPAKSNKISPRFAVNIGEFLNINSTLVDRMNEHYKYEGIFFGYNYIKEKSIAECGLKTRGVTCC